MRPFATTAGILAVALLGAGVWWMNSGGGPARAAGVVVPELSGTAAEGQQAFRQYCADCHGDDADGTDLGPPLIHPFYEPGHHGDHAFVRAVRQGSPAHHWRFGDMPPVAGVSDAELAAIIDYVRTVQRANGIE